MPGKLYKVARFMIPSANPAIPFASSLAMVSYNSEKVLWETAIVMPIGADGKNVFLFQFTTFISAPNLEQATAGFCNEDNLTGIREYGAAWASGDMERLQAVLAPDFTLTVEGEDCPVARDDLPTFYANSREQATF